MRLTGNPQFVSVRTGEGATDFDTGGVTNGNRPTPRCTQSTPIDKGWGRAKVTHASGVVFQNGKCHALAIPFGPQAGESPKRYHILGGVYALNQKIGFSWFLGRCGLGALSTGDAGTIMTDIHWLGATRQVTQAGMSHALIDRIVDFQTDVDHEASAWLFGVGLFNLVGAATSPAAHGEFSVRRYDEQHWPEDPYPL